MRNRKNVDRKQSHKRNVRALLVLALPLLMFPAFIARSDPGISGIKPYRFSEQLATSSTWIQSRDDENVFGTWQKNGFAFEGLANIAEVRATKHRRQQGDVQAGIRFNTIKNVKRVLEFPNVPPGREIKLSYGVISKRDEKEQVSYVNLRIWIGQKLIKELRIQNNPGWNDVYIPLGIYSFLNRKGVFRLELFSDAAKPVFFDFEIEMI